MATRIGSAYMATMATYIVLAIIGVLCRILVWLLPSWTWLWYATTIGAFARVCCAGIYWLEEERNGHLLGALMMRPFLFMLGTGIWLAFDVRRALPELNKNGVVIVSLITSTVAIRYCYIYLFRVEDWDDPVS